MSDASLNDINGALDKAFGPSPSATEPKQTKSHALSALAPTGQTEVSTSGLGDIATGMVSQVPGIVGDVESLGRRAINFFGGDVSSETVTPTTEDIETKIKGPAESDESQTLRNIGAVLSPGLAVPGAGVAKAAKAATATGRMARLGEDIASGEIGKSVLASPRAAADARRAAADTAYAQADTAMAAKQATIPWQQHPSGRAFLDSLEDRIRTIGETKETAGTRADLQKIHDDLLGGKDPSGNIAPSQPTVIREVLRKLRDRAAGVPETGFDAIAQQRAGDLADDLAQSISNWEPSLAQADARYRAMSEQLYPKGVEPGKFAQEFEDAKGAINTLEKQVKDGTVPKEDAVAAVRNLLKRETVSRLVDSKTAQDLNRRLTKIEAAAKRGKTYRKYAGYGAGGLAAGLGLHYGSRLFGVH